MNLRRLEKAWWGMELTNEELAEQLIKVLSVSLPEDCLHKGSIVDRLYVTSPQVIAEQLTAYSMSKERTHG